ncbi:MAG: YjbQ family protein [Deltaproteobacteria bacterium]|nr:YjbQ family protein [Deltaproteobacteria bacterium]
MEQFTVRTKNRTEFIDITAEVGNVLRKTGIENGVCYVYTPHTTAAITINENADPSVSHDINTQLNSIAPFGNRYAHREGNADAHIKSTLVGCSESVFVKNGTMALGTWQGIFFCEFDGPRSRTVYVKVIAG